MIAYPSPQGFKIAAKAQLLTELAWTPPVSWALGSTSATAGVWWLSTWGERASRLR